jgi:hypothetical protein
MAAVCFSETLEYLTSTQCRKPEQDNHLKPMIIAFMVVHYISGKAVD